MTTPNPAKDFPWAGSSPWDVDVAIIGAGPAGMAAAIRLRWMKTFPMTPVSAALINSGPLGGLASLGNSILTGPSLAFPAGGLVQHLQKDLEQWPLPQIQARVDAIERDGNGFRLHLDSGHQITALSVIIACGMLDLRNLADFWQKGVSATFGNRENIFKILDKELKGSTSPVIIGGEQLLKMAEYLKDLNPKTHLILPETSAGAASDLDIKITCGQLDKAKTADGKIAAITVRQDGKPRSIPTDKIILEFNSLELQHHGLPQGLPLGSDGFFATPDTGVTNMDGLFAAGDCCGPPFSAVVAIGQGVEAAFNAYRYVHEKKFGQEAALFAYYGDHRVTDNPDQPEFPLLPELVPARLVDDCPLDNAAEVWQLINGKNSLAELASLSTLLEKDIQQQITNLLTARAINFRPL